jgi:hypothetical protein
VVAVTSFSAKYQMKSLLNLGFYNVVYKPLNTEDIITTIRGVLEKNDTSGPAP